MVVVAVVSGTTKEEHVLLEAGGRAADLETDVHVLYVLGLGWYANLEVHLSDRVGIPTGLETIRGICESRADRIAAPLLDEYVPAGRIGRPIEEIVQYADEVDAHAVVVDADVDWGAGLDSVRHDPIEQLRAEGVGVVPVY